MTLKLDNRDIALINRVQKNFPLCERPFEVIAESLGESSDWVLSRLKLLDEEKVISRFGSVVKRKNDSFSTLAALKVPHERVNDIAHFWLKERKPLLITT